MPDNMLPVSIGCVWEIIFFLCFFLQHQNKSSDFKDDRTTRWEQWILASQLTFQNNIILVQNSQIVSSLPKIEIHMW